MVVVKTFFFPFCVLGKAKFVEVSNFQFFPSGKIKRESWKKLLKETIQRRTKIEIKPNKATHQLKIGTLNMTLT